MLNIHLNINFLMTEVLESNITSFILDGVLYCVASGVLKQDEMFQIARKLIKTAREKNLHKYLFDHRNIAFRFEKSELYHLSFHLKDLGLKEDDKVAVLLPDDSLNQWYAGFETSSVLHGNKVKIFNNEDIALQWLKQ